GELTIGNAADDDHLAAEFFQQSGTEQAPGAMVAVDQHAKMAVADLVAVDRSQDSLKVSGVGISDTADAADLCVPRPLRRGGAIPLGDLCTGGRADHPAVAAKQLDAVVLRWIV